MRVMCISESNNNQCLTSYNISKYQNLTYAKLNNDKDMDEVSEKYDKQHKKLNS